MNLHINRDKHKLELGKCVMIHAYKYNGWLYRCWDFPKVIMDNDEYTIVDLTNIKIISAEKNTKRSFINWSNKKAFWVFMKHKWFNFRVSKNNKGEGYKIYVNLASPFIYEESAIKYYDFDLDFKFVTNGSWCKVDIKDLEENSIKYKYPPKLMAIIKDVEIEIWHLIKEGFFEQFVSKTCIQAMNKLMDLYKYGPIKPKKDEKLKHDR